jgi:ferritin-like metal-binding protein YciE
MSHAVLAAPRSFFNARLSASRRPGLARHSQVAAAVSKHNSHGEQAMAVNNLKDALIEEMRDILNAEKQITKALKKMIKNAHDSELKAGFQEHLEQTEDQIERLEEAFDLLGQKARGKQCEAMSGILQEGEEVMEAAENSDILDAMMIAAAQKVEHYEIATYGTLCQWAQTLGLDEVEKLLHATLEEEKITDEKLTRLAKSINPQAQPAGMADTE